MPSSLSSVTSSPLLLNFTSLSVSSLKLSLSSSPMAIIEEAQSPQSGLKRKLDHTSEDRDEFWAREIAACVDVLRATFSWKRSDREAAMNAAETLVLYARSGNLVKDIVDGDAVPALVMHLKAPPCLKEEDDDNGLRLRPLEHEVEARSAFALGLLAVNLEYQQLIADAGSLPHLVSLLRRHRDGSCSDAANSAIRRASDAVTYLAFENSTVKDLVRAEGGIPPLVELLEDPDQEVQRAAAASLHTLALKNNDNKNKIVECDALSLLILLMQYEDAVLQCEVIGVIGNLVHSSPHMKEEMLLAGGLQPIIRLLSSCHSEIQKEAAC